MPRRTISVNDPVGLTADSAEVLLSDLLSDEIDLLIASAEETYGPSTGIAGAVPDGTITGPEEMPTPTLSQEVFDREVLASGISNLPSSRPPPSFGGFQFRQALSATVTTAWIIEPTPNPTTRSGRRRPLVAMSIMRDMLKHPENYDYSTYEYSADRLFSQKRSATSRLEALHKLITKYSGMEFETCHRTGLRDLRSRMYWIPSEQIWLCYQAYNALYRLCSICQQIVARGNLMRRNDGAHVCETCADYHLVWVGGQLYHRDFAPGTASNPIHTYSTNVLHAYGREPAQKRKLDTEKAKYPLWLGVELEVEAGSREIDRLSMARRTLEEVKDFAILKSDSSLRNGYEIVTIPATLAYHKSGIWDAFFEGSAKKLKSYRTDTCGMHVHIDKLALGAREDQETSLTIGKMLVFVNSPSNRPFIEAVAGRSADEYCRAYPKKLTSKDDESSHHDALSFSRHGTMELRIFRGNVRKEGFFKNLEFTAALCEFAASTSTAKLHWMDFMTWFQRERAWSRYRYLASWLLRTKRLPGKPFKLEYLSDEELAA